MDVVWITSKGCVFEKQKNNMNIDLIFFFLSCLCNIYFAKWNKNQKNDASKRNASIKGNIFFIFVDDYICRKTWKNLEWFLILYCRYGFKKKLYLKFRFIWYARECFGMKHLIKPLHHNYFSFFFNSIKYLPVPNGTTRKKNIKISAKRQFCNWIEIFFWNVLFYEPR